ncbi:hypothetical protein BY996DRAFT_6450571 [Phakopsora pachyrhizi]|nr:hypothetical protein BY996DRAFT_6450571 [Phakopsora pachyrhizi]
MAFAIENGLTRARERLAKEQINFKIDLLLNLVSWARARVGWAGRFDWARAKGRVANLQINSKIDLLLICKQGLFGWTKGNERLVKEAMAGAETRGRLAIEQIHSKINLLSIWDWVDKKDKSEKKLEDETDENGEVTYIKRDVDIWHASIFKVDDDCGQGLLALKIIVIHKTIYESMYLDLHLVPYRVTATAAGV